MTLPTGPIFPQPRSWSDPLSFKAIYIPYFLLKATQAGAAEALRETKTFMSCSVMRFMSTRFQYRVSTYEMSCASLSEPRLKKEREKIQSRYKHRANRYESYITHVFSLARMNSDTVKNGTFWTFMTVDVSRWRGPVSPAGSISIYCGA